MQVCNHFHPSTGSSPICSPSFFPPQSAAQAKLPMRLVDLLVVVGMDEEEVPREDGGEGGTGGG
jgi:hypothetical protein